MTGSIFFTTGFFEDASVRRFGVRDMLGFAGLVAFSLVAFSLVAPVQAQSPSEAALRPALGLASNVVQVLEARGDSLWIGPNLALTTDGGTSFRETEARALQSDDNVLFAVDVRPGLPSSSLVAAGLAFAADGQSAAGGFLLSRDGGASFQFEPPALDAAQDTTVSYGVSTLRARPVVREAGSAPARPRYFGLWRYAVAGCRASRHSLQYKRRQLMAARCVASRHAQRNRPEHGLRLPAQRGYRFVRFLQSHWQ